MVTPDVPGLVMLGGYGVGMKLIPMRTDKPLYLTTREYEEVNKLILAKVLAGDVTLADKIVAKILVDNAHRYQELVYEEVNESGI